MKAIKVIAAATLVLVASAATAAPRLSAAEVEELAQVAQTLKMAELCKVPSARYSELTRYKVLAKKTQVSAGASEGEVEQAFSRGVSHANEKASSLDATKCAVVFQDIDKANQAFANLNKTLTSLDAVASDLERALRSR